MKLWRDLEPDEKIQAGDRFFVQESSGKYALQFVEDDHLSNGCLASEFGEGYQRPVEFPDNAISPVEQVKTVPQDEIDFYKLIYREILLRADEFCISKDASSVAFNAAICAVNDLRKFKKGSQ